MRQWSSPLCECSWPGIRTTCYAACCTACAYGTVGATLPPGSAPGAGDYDESCCIYLLGGRFDQLLQQMSQSSGAGLVTCSLTYAQRRAFAKSRGIELNEKKEAVYSACFAPCAIAQELREIERAPQQVFGVCLKPPTQTIML
jgi:hypothetical protein